MFEDLTLVNLAVNKLCKGHIHFLTCSVEASDILCNQIEEVKLTFPRPTKLTYLALHGNKIKGISDESSGDNPRLYRLEWVEKKGNKSRFNITVPNGIVQNYFKE